MEHFEEFFNSYIEAALWSSTDNSNEQGGDPLDSNYTADDFDPESLESLKAVARVWLYRNGCYIAALVPKCPTPSADHSLYELAGHDLWLTQNGHGTGFWDRDHWGCYQDMFDNAAKALGEIDLTVSEGKIYA